MKKSLAMHYVEAYAQSMATQLKDDKIRMIYYFMGILSCTNWNNDKCKDELEHLKKTLTGKGFTNINTTVHTLISYAKEMLENKDVKDDFFELPDYYLLEAHKLQQIFKSDEVKVWYLLIPLFAKEIYWANPNFKGIQVQQKPIDNIIKDKLSKAFILTFYYKNKLSYEVHIASNAKELILGRDTYCDIRFDEKHDFISRKHCMITCHNNHYYIQDLGSTQSTYVNDILIGNKNVKSKYIELKDGDIIGLSDDIKISVNIFNIHEMKTKPCMLCQRTFYTANDSDLCPMCAYEFAKDFGQELTINEVSSIPTKFNIENKVYNQKVAKIGNELELTFKFDQKVNQPVKKEELPKAEVNVKEVNDIIPGYEKIKTIGEGGMGSVYLVKERKTGKTMALKTIKPIIFSDKKSKMIFEREAFIQQQMNHKYVAKQYGYGEYEGMQYILMEYYQYGTLVDHANKIKADKKLLKDIFIQILNGLDYLHHASVKSKLKNGEEVIVEGIVHRDIKPQNIFVDYDSKGNMMIKIADFGLSKAFETAGESGLSETGYTMGTFQFMPRQQLEDAKYAKPEVDIWAATAVIYALATGFVPKPFSKDKDPVLTCADEKVIPIKKRDWLFPAKFAKIIDQALDDDCEQLYYQEATDLINDLLKIKV